MRLGASSRPLALMVVAAVLASACGSDGEESDAVTATTGPTTAVAATTPSTTVAAPVFTAPEPTPIEPGAGWELVWNDEFDGAAIDPANWTFDIGGWGWGNGEAQYYTDRAENARVENGLLVIEGRQEQYEDSYYTSARLRTQGLQEFQYGRFEARMKVPRGLGTWPAFWMLGAHFEQDSDVEENNWPFVGEIDIMEHLGRDPDLIMGTAHGPGYSGALGITKWNRQEFDIADEFHTYAVEWEADEIRWYFDGELYSTLLPKVVGEREWVFDHPFFLIVNLALGGTLPGPIGLDTQFPLHLLVDHVRVYQRIAE